MPASMMMPVAAVALVVIIGILLLCICRKLGTGKNHSGQVNYTCAHNNYTSYIRSIYLLACVLCIHWTAYSRRFFFIVALSSVFWRAFLRNNCFCPGLWRFTYSET
jgi:hypothetical protein